MLETITLNRKESPTEDLMLVARIVRADAQALARLYEKYQRKVYSVVLRIVKTEEDAREILQDVFMQVWQKANLFEANRGSFSAWLVTLAHNKAINLLRSRRAKKTALEIKQDLEQLSELITDRTIETRTALDLQVESDEREHLLALLELIPVEQKTALVMAYYGGYSQSEIAKALGEPLGTIKTRMRQGMIRLHQLIGNNTDAY
jgi:RNA polymerase sigma-70 factor (ECF subfamily)